MSIITIDCSGTIFKTTELTLRKSDFFNSILERWNTKKTIFLDEDDRYFRVILIYLRDDVIEKNTLDPELLVTKFKYYFPYAINDELINKTVKKISSVYYINETMISNTYNTSHEFMSGYISEKICSCSRWDAYCRCGNDEHPQGFKLLMDNVNNFYIEPISDGFLEQLIPIKSEIVACRYIGNDMITNKTIIVIKYLTDIIAIADIEIGSIITIDDKYQITRAIHSYEIGKIDK